MISNTRATRVQGSTCGSEVFAIKLKLFRRRYLGPTELRKSYNMILPGTLVSGPRSFDAGLGNKVREKREAAWLATFEHVQDSWITCRGNRIGPSVIGRRAATVRSTRKNGVTFDALTATPRGFRVLRIH